MLGHVNTATSQDKGCSCGNIKTERLISTCTTVVHSVMDFSWNVLGMSSHDLGNGCAFLRCFPLHLKSQEERSNLRLRYTPSYDTLNDIRHFHT